MGPNMRAIIISKGTKYAYNLDFKGTILSWFWILDLWFLDKIGTKMNVI